MTYDQEENIMGWCIVVWAIISVIAIYNASHLNHIKVSKSVPCTHESNQ